jgi:hypothetical protein
MKWTELFNRAMRPWREKVGAERPPTSSEDMAHHRRRSDSRVSQVYKTWAGRTLLLTYFP